MDHLLGELPGQLNCNYCDTLVWHSENLRCREGDGIVDDETDNGNFTESSLQFRSQLFHGFSDECRPCCDDTEGLCGLCRHNRFGHIVRHMDQIWRVCHITIEMGPLSDIQARQDCKVCRIITQAAERDETIQMSDKIFLKIHRIDQTFLDYRTENTHVTCLSILPASHNSDQSPLVMLYLRYDRDSEVLRGTFVNWNRIKGWLRDCAYEDHDCYAESLENPPSGFRLIDVKNLGVVQAPSACEYAALSYVWGPPDLGHGWVPAATRQNTLETTGSLSRDKVPPTIEDAIEACSRLGIRYLWIDRYCIVQDDEQMKENQIDAMDRIYSHAVLTLVAVEGEDPGYGLPGVSEPRNPILCLELVELSMVEQVSSIPEVFKKSKWAERGWTFQEAILSNRLLYFMNGDVAYECCCGDHQFEHGLEAMRSPYPSLLGRKQYDYFEAIPEFSERQLSNSRDTLRAITGVLNSLHGKRHQYGLPLDFFNEAILWVTVSDESSHDTNSVRDLFPSWSWSSSPTSVTYLTSVTCYGAHDYRMTSIATWVSVIEGPNGDLMPQIIGTRYDKLQRKESLWDIIPLPWERGSIKYAPQVSGPFLDDDEIGHRGSSKDESGLSDLFKESLSDMCGLIPDHCFQSVITELANSVQTARFPGRILVLAQCAPMKLGWEKYKCGKKTIFWLHSSTPAGYLSLDNIADLKLLVDLDDQKPVELIAISLKFGYRLPEMENLEGVECGGLPTILICFCRTQRVVDALLTIRSADSNECRRIGFAEINLHDWTKLKPDIRTSVLE